MTAPPIQSLLLSEFAAYPWACEPLEEIGAIEPADAAAALAFALDRLTRFDQGPDPRPDPRPWVMATTPSWLRERGRPFAQGLRNSSVGTLSQTSAGPAPDRLIWVRAETEAAALWALEEALKSGAVAGGLASAERPAFVTTRRLDFAARAGAARGILLRAGPVSDLSAARRRWRIAAKPSGAARFDKAAPGPARLRAELVRRRDGAPGVWELEQSDETGRFGMVARLAGHGLETAGPDHRRSAA